MHYNILTIYIDKPDEGNKVTNGGHREVLLVFWTRAGAQNHLEFGCKVLFDHYHPPPSNHHLLNGSRPLKKSRI